MTINKMNELKKSILREMYDLDVQAIESWDMQPYEVPFSFRYKLIAKVYKRFDIEPTVKLLQDGLTLYTNDLVIKSLS